MICVYRCTCLWGEKRSGVLLCQCLPQSLRLGTCSFRFQLGWQPASSRKSSFPSLPSAGTTVVGCHACLFYDVSSFFGEGFECNILCPWHLRGLHRETDFLTCRGFSRKREYSGKFHSSPQMTQRTQSLPLLGIYPEKSMIECNQFLVLQSWRTKSVPDLPPKRRLPQPSQARTASSCALLFKKKMSQAGEMAQWLRVPAVLPEILSSIPSNHMVAHNHL